MENQSKQNERSNNPNIFSRLHGGYCVDQQNGALMFKNPKLMTDAEIKQHADRIRAMADFSELVALCRVDSRFALFCGVKPDDSIVIINKAVEQWDACRKNIK